MANRRTTNSYGFSSYVTPYTRSSYYTRTHGAPRNELGDPLPGSVEPSSINFNLKKWALTYEEASYLDNLQASMRGSDNGTIKDLPYNHAVQQLLSHTYHFDLNKINEVLQWCKDNNQLRLHCIAARVPGWKASPVQEALDHYKDRAPGEFLAFAKIAWPDGRWPALLLKQCHAQAEELISRRPTPYPNLRSALKTTLMPLYEALNRYPLALLSFDKNLFPDPAIVAQALHDSRIDFSMPEDALYILPTESARYEDKLQSYFAQGQMAEFKKLLEEYPLFALAVRVDMLDQPEAILRALHQQGIPYTLHLPPNSAWKAHLQTISQLLAEADCSMVSLHFHVDAIGYNDADLRKGFHSAMRRNSSLEAFTIHYPMATYDLGLDQLVDALVTRSQPLQHVILNGNYCPTGGVFEKGDPLLSLIKSGVKTITLLEQNSLPRFGVMLPAFMERLSSSKKLGPVIFQYFTSHTHNWLRTRDALEQQILQHQAPGSSTISSRHMYMVSTNVAPATPDTANSCPPSSSDRPNSTTQLYTAYTHTGYGKIAGAAGYYVKQERINEAQEAQLNILKEDKTEAFKKMLNYYNNDRAYAVAVKNRETFNHCSRSDPSVFSNSHLSVPIELFAAQHRVTISPGDALLLDFLQGYESQIDKDIEQFRHVLTPAWDDGLEELILKLSCHAWSVEELSRRAAPECFFSLPPDKMSAVLLRLKFYLSIEELEAVERVLAAPQASTPVIPASQGQTWV